MKKSKPSRASRRAALSCSASCDKCGATDIYRRHRRAAERFNKDMGDYTTWENAHVRYDTYYAFAKCECIVHHCRTCGYEWATDIHKPNAPRERTAVAGTIDGVVGNSGLEGGQDGR